MQESNDTLIRMTDVAKHFQHLALKDDIVVFETDFSREDPLKYPLRFDSLYLCLVEKGSCDITIDLRKFHAETNSLVVIQPKNYVTVHNIGDECVISILTCSRYMVEEVLPVLTDILPLLLHHRVEPVKKLSEEGASGLRMFYKFLKQKLSGPQTPFLRSKLLCILQAALFELLDIHASTIDSRTAPKTRKDEIMARFIVAVSENFRENRQVSFYAEKLCITPKHLSAVVKDISGRTAGDWIENYVGMEAKVLLKSTDLTVQEIAARLNFANQSFFGKYFKHLTGLSPTEYRRSLQIKSANEEHQGNDNIADI